MKGECIKIYKLNSGNPESQNALNHNFKGRKDLTDDQPIPWVAQETETGNLLHMTD